MSCTPRRLPWWGLGSTACRISRTGPPCTRPRIGDHACCRVPFPGTASSVVVHTFPQRCSSRSGPWRERRYVIYTVVSAHGCYHTYNKHTPQTYPYKGVARGLQLHLSPYLPLSVSLLSLSPESPFRPRAGASRASRIRWTALARITAAVCTRGRAGLCRVEATTRVGDERYDSVLSLVA